MSDILPALSRADQLYSQRSQPGAVEESVAVLKRFDGGAEEFETGWRLARALFFLGQEASTAGASERLHAAGVEAASRSVSLNRARVEGHFWLGVNLALFAQSRGGIKAVRALFRARRALGRAVSICESYHEAGPLRVLGRLEHKAPWFLGGSLRRSRSYFDRALRIAPRNSVTLVYAAELALDCGDERRAVEMLKKVIESPVDTGWEFENRRDRRIAESILARLGLE